MQTSETIGEIATALAAAQGELENTHKDQKAVAGKARYTYANIASVLADVRPVLARHGLAVVQGVGRDEQGDVLVTTRLVHRSGEWMESALPLPVDRMGGIQGVGSAITYGRRYGLQAMLGIASDDDDGAAAQAQPPQRSGPPAWVPRAREHAESVGVAWADVIREMGEPPERWRDGQRVRAVIDGLAGGGES